jgi:hypothetical protein
MIEIGIGIYEKNAFNAGCMKILRILGWKSIQATGVWYSLYEGEGPNPFSL